jgi:predicted small lipoprotein YifL
MTARARWLAALLALAVLAGCGKKGAPNAPGPADQLTYPRIYPTY